MGVTEKKFGTTVCGKDVMLYHIENASGAYAEVINYGAILVKVCVPDKEGKLTDVVLGYDTMEGYNVNGCFFGATIGPNGNRIANARFVINGKEYVIAQNENENNLHSGPEGFETRLWNAEVSQEDNSVTFSRISPDGECGFPGELKASVTYTLTKDNEVRLTYQGVSDQATIANMTNHSYFNLAGEGSGDILGQYLTIHAENYTPVCDSKSIPVGVKALVEGTPMDFRTAKKIGQDIEADFEQLKYTGGYDHNYVTDNYEAGKVRPIAEAYCEETGIAMEVTSDCPCVQLYAGNFIKNENGKNGHVYVKRTGFCLETQVEPNAVNEPSFHSPVIEAGEKYYSVTGYRFFVK